MLVPKGVAVDGSAPEKLEVPLPRPRPKDIVADNAPAAAPKMRP
jgi:hypothetical protein